ncbi:hypothetical protein Tco_1016769 [Tanacetum coccineum]|uniref:Uncharacterized protein n=1 Tax=Tanacetum coccineum TaxID=301880 RepID=A0ABQ5FQ74_9ASTR
MWVTKTEQGSGLGFKGSNHLGLRKSFIISIVILKSSGLTIGSDSSAVGFGSSMMCQNGTSGQEYDFTPKEGLKNKSQMVETASGILGFATSDKAAGLMRYKLKQQNSAASILFTATVVTYCVAVHKKVFWFVFGGDAVGYGCDLIEYFIIMVVIVLLSLVSTASYVLVLPVFTLYCQRKLALFEFKDEFLCYWISAIIEERKQLYMLRSWKPNYWLTSPIGIKRLNAAQIHVLLGLRGGLNTAGLFVYNSSMSNVNIVC